LFAYLLDQEITRQTNGEKSLDDVLKYLFQKGKFLDSMSLADGIRSVTGKDFSQIINDYLLDKNPLPLLRNGSGISVDVEKIAP
jgi:predicted metalloprotease with PDZ domain